MSKVADVEPHDNILREYPGPVILFPSRTKWAGVITAGACLTMASIISIFLGRPLVGLFGSMFFGSAMLVGIIALLPGSSSLRLDRQRFICKRFYYSRAYRWNDVSDFGVWVGRGGNVVVFQVAKPRPNILERMNKAVSGRNEFLPDTYGLRPETLVELMIEWGNLATGEIKRNTVSSMQNLTF